MRLYVRKAKIATELRTAFEQFGPLTMQGILAAGGTFRLQGKPEWVEGHREALLSWLTEYSDREERKEAEITRQRSEVSCSGVAVWGDTTHSPSPLHIGK